MSIDDESFTYNARISRVSPIQEHRMIMKAVQNGVSPDRIAAALNLPLRVVQAAMNLLSGIHEDAVEMLKDKLISPKTIRLLRKVKPLRQTEIVEMMKNGNNFAATYAEAMVLATPWDQMANPDEAKKTSGMSPEAIAKMEEEMMNQERDMKAIDQMYGENMLNLTVVRSNIKRLLDNAKVVRFLNANHAEIFGEFEKVAAAEGV